VHFSLLHHLRRNAVAYLALFIALGGTSLAAATVITGKDVKNSSLTGKDVKNSSLTGKDIRVGSVNSGDVQDGSLLGQDFAPGQLPAGAQGPKGDTGAKGTDGTNGIDGTDGTDATINGVAAGGDLTGSFPNPSIAGGKITTAKLAPGMQEATVLDVPRGTLILGPGTFGPRTGTLRLEIECAAGYMAIYYHHLAGTSGEMHATYVRGTSTVKRKDNTAANDFHTDILFTDTDAGGSPGNDTGTGNFIFHAGAFTVTGTFSYLADATHCRLLAGMQLMQVSD